MSSRLYVRTFWRDIRAMGGGDSLAAEDDALISLFEMARAAGMARKRFPGRPGDSVWFLRFALARRQEVITRT